jgi:hypothetical protein
VSEEWLVFVRIYTGRNGNSNLMYADQESLTTVVPGSIHASIKLNSMALVRERTIPTL